MTRALLLIVFGAWTPLFAQTSAVLAGAGYSSPAPFLIAPGQVLTLFVRGVPAAADGQLRSAQAGVTPFARLPITLAGLSVRVTQGPSFSQQVPIFAVRQENDCAQSGSGDPACLLTSIKIQIPFEISGDVTVTETRQVTYSPVAQISIDVDGRAGRPFPAQPVPDNAHVLTTCDASWDTSPSSVCNRQVYHADGTPVDEKSPAGPGETVKVYAYGLGTTDPQVPSGVESPSGAAVTDLLGSPRVTAPFQLNFLNALSSGPRLQNVGFSADTPVLPVTPAALAPGQIGAYQLNVSLPLSLSSYFLCGGEVHTNAILTIRTSQGSEGISLCVQP